MARLNETIKYPLSMTTIAFGVGAIVLSFLLDLVLTESMVAGLLGLWGIVVAVIGVLGVVIIWAVGKLD
jgi:uncharacterized membrane protein YdcZ (DUF606 family)